MASEEWSTIWISLRFSDDQGDTEYLRWYASVGSDLLLVLSADDPILRHLASGPQPISVAAVAARGMNRSLRHYIPAIVTADRDTGLSDAINALRGKYRWRWMIDRTGRSMGRIVHRAGDNDIVVSIRPEPAIV